MNTSMCATKHLAHEIPLKVAAKSCHIFYKTTLPIHWKVSNDDASYFTRDGKIQRQH